MFVQFQEHLLSKALKRIIVPDSSYPNEGKIELRQRAVSYLESLGIGPVSEQIDPVSLHYQSLYFWWGFALKQLLTVSRDQRIEDGEYRVMREMFDEIPQKHRNPLMMLAESVISNYIYIRNMKYSLLQVDQEIPLVVEDLKERQLEIEGQLEESALMIETMRAQMQGGDHLDGQQISSDKELEEVWLSFLFLIFHFFYQFYYKILRFFPMIMPTWVYPRFIVFLLLSPTTCNYPRKFLYAD